MTTNLPPVLNIADNWSQFSSTSNMLNGNSMPSQSQYGMWMGSAMTGNISPNQSCSMPYLRNTGYSIPSSTSPTIVSSTSGSMLSSQTTYDQCDISNFVPTPNRDISRNSNWSPLTPPPIWMTDFKWQCGKMLVYFCDTKIRLRHKFCFWAELWIDSSFSLILCKCSQSKMPTAPSGTRVVWSRGHRDHVMLVYHVITKITFNLGTTEEIILRIRGLVVGVSTCLFIHNIYMYRKHAGHWYFSAPLFLIHVNDFSNYLLIIMLLALDIDYFIVTSPNHL